MAVPVRLENYCNDFTSKIMESSFPKSGKISGPEILNFSPVKQLNLFIIKNLMIEWQREIEKLRSPFFDFEAEEVQDALKDFGNVLSRNISISKEDFRPLVYLSTVETITLLTSPYEFYISLANLAIEKQYSLEELESTRKYIKHNQFIFELFLQEIKSDSYAPDTYPAVIEGVIKHTDQTPEDPDAFIKQLSSILPFDSDILNEEEDLAEEADPAPAEPVANTGSQNQATINDQLMSESPKSLADVHQEMKIEDIQSSLNLNQKFMFINGLFDGDESKFNKVVKKIESLKSFNEAKSYIESEFSWDEEAREEVDEFYEVLAKRLP